MGKKKERPAFGDTGRLFFNQPKPILPKAMPVPVF